MSAIFVYMTAPDEAVATDIARALVEERLVACVNLLPGMRSLYRWHGAVEEAAEIVLIAKTVSARLAALQVRVRALHPYECPCIVALPVAGGDAAYLAWIAAETLP